MPYDHDFEPGAYGVCRRCGEERHGPAGSASRRAARAADTAKLHRFNGKTGRSNSRTHAAESKNPASGGLRYKALCGALIITTGGGVERVDCPRCLKEIRRG